MDEEKKKQINEAIAVLRDMCFKHLSCKGCPMRGKNCNYLEVGEFDIPCNWQDID